MSEDREAQRMHYARWADSDDWQTMFLPEIEKEIAAYQRQFELVDPSDAVAVALIQGGLRAMRYLRDKPDIELKKIAKEDEREESEDAQKRREDRGSLRRLLALTRGR